MGGAPEGPLEIPEGMFDQAKALADALPADVSFGVGFKQIGGELTDTVALIVYVPEKKSESDLLPDQLIPQEFGGFPVDVVEWNPIPIEDPAFYDRLHGGIEIAPDPTQLGDSPGLVNQERGTLGAIARRRSDQVQVMLTASHVIEENHVLVGDIHQPAGGAVVGNTGTGTVERHDQGLDCAAVETNGSRQMRATVEGVGPIRGVRPLTVASLNGADLRVKKRGRTTELTHGRITAIRAPVVNAPTLELSIAPAQSDTLFAWKGDSGSVVLNTGDEVVGLLYAVVITRGTRDNPVETHGVATVINFVQDALGVDVVVGSGSGGGGGGRPGGGTRPTLRQGARGDDVRLLQDALVAAGYLEGAVDGIFGKGTAAAVTRFQADHAPPPDGVVGRGTWAKLVELGHAAPA